MNYRWQLVTLGMKACQPSGRTDSLFEEKHERRWMLVIRNFFDLYDLGKTLKSKLVNCYLVWGLNFSPGHVAMIYFLLPLMTFRGSISLKRYNWLGDLGAHTYIHLFERVIQNLELQEQIALVHRLYLTTCRKNGKLFPLALCTLSTGRVGLFPRRMGVLWLSRM